MWELAVSTKAVKQIAATKDDKSERAKEAVEFAFKLSESSLWELILEQALLIVPSLVTFMVLVGLFLNF